MSDYGAVSSDSLDSGAVTSAVFRNLLPFVASNSSSAQIEKGDTYCREARKLLEEHYHKFSELSKKEIMDYTRRVDEAKKRVDKSSWFVQKQASQYADLAQGLYRAVDTKAQIERANIIHGYTNLTYVVDDPTNPNATPLQLVHVSDSVDVTSVRNAPSEGSESSVPANQELEEDPECSH